MKTYGFLHFDYSFLFYLPSLVCRMCIRRRHREERFFHKISSPRLRYFGKTENGKGVKCLLNPSLIISTNFVGRRLRLKTYGFLPFNFISIFFFRFLPPTYVYTPLGRRTENFPQNLVAPLLRVGFAGASKKLR